MAACAPSTRLLWCAGDQDALKRAGLVTPTSPEELEADLAGMAQERSAGEASSSGRDESGEQAFPQ